MIATAFPGDGRRHGVIAPTRRPRRQPAATTAAAASTATNTGRSRSSAPETPRAWPEPPLLQAVATRPRAGRGPGRGEDRLLQALQGLAGLDPELLGERPACCPGRPAALRPGGRSGRGRASAAHAAAPAADAGRRAPPARRSGRRAGRASGRRRSARSARSGEVPRAGRSPRGRTPRRRSRRAGTRARAPAPRAAAATRAPARRQPVPVYLPRTAVGSGRRRARPARHGAHSLAPGSAGARRPGRDAAARHGSGGSSPAVGGGASSHSSSISRSVDSDSFG